MKTKKNPMRTCVVTREKQEKKNLIRVVRTPEGEVIIDLTGKSNGRGAYITKDLTVLEKAKKSKVLDRHLEVEVPSSIYTELENIINND
jgi:predicted RNA-binding protein YlxR (DUF448 family)